MGDEERDSGADMAIDETGREVISIKFLRQAGRNLTHEVSEPHTKC